MKKATAPISVAGSQLGEVRHVCAFFNSDDEEYRVLLPFIKEDSNVATRRSTSSIPISVAAICSDWPQQGSTHRLPSRVGNSNFSSTPKRTFVMAVSIRIRC